MNDTPDIHRDGDGSATVTCVTCGTVVVLPPAAMPGFVLLAPLDGWTVGPPRCPVCSGEPPTPD